MENLKMGEVKCTINEQEIMLPFYTAINKVGNLEINICLTKNKFPTLDWCELCIKDKNIKEFFDYHYLEILNITGEQAEDFNFICNKFGLYEYLDLSQVQAYELLIEKIKEYNDGWEPDFLNQYQKKCFVSYNHTTHRYIRDVSFIEQRHSKEFYLEDRESCDELIDNYKWLLDKYFEVERSEARE